MSKRAEEKALEAYPNDSFVSVEYADMCRSFFQEGYELAEKDLGWHSVEESLPPVGEDVIVLADRLNLGSMYAIAIGHIVDKEKAVDYDGWNIPGVKFWMPMPKIPNEK